MEFSYTAITKNGGKESATIQAPNISVAGHLLKEQGLLPIHIEEQNKKGKKLFGGIVINISCKKEPFLFINKGEKVTLNMSNGCLK